MGKSLEDTLYDLIIQQLDESGRKLFRLCSIPSFFTKDLIVFCLPVITEDEVDDAYIDDFLSQPFFSKRVTGTGSGQFEYYMIHQLIKASVQLTAREIKELGSALVKYFDMKCSTLSPPQLDRYFNEKLRCEVKMGCLTSWRKAFQATLELNRIQERIKLLEILEDSGIDEISLWHFYYALVHRYCGIEPVQNIISELECFLAAESAEENGEYYDYCLIFLGVLYDKAGRWRDARRQYETVLNAFRTCAKYNEDILASVSINLVAVCCRMNDFQASAHWVETVRNMIPELSAGIKISAYRALGLWEQQIYRWGDAYAMYYGALQCIFERQEKCLLDIAKIYNSFKPYPICHSDEIGIYNRLGEILLLQGKFKESLHFHQKELQSQILSESMVGIAWAEYNIGKVQYLSGDTESAKEILYRSVEDFKKTDNISNRAYPLAELSYVFQYDGEPDDSLKCLKKSVEILLTTENIDRCLFCFNHIGRICQAQGFLTFAHQIFELCEEYYESNSESENYGWILNNIARNYMYSGDYTHAKQYFENALEHFLINFNKRGQSYIYNNLAELFIKTENIPAAEKLFMKSLSMKKEMGDEHAICYTYREIGELYLRLERVEQAASALSEAERICAHGNYVMLKGDIDISIGKLRQYQNDLIAASDYYQKAEGNYKAQNFLTRLTNCYELECVLAEKMKDEELTHKLHQAVNDTAERRVREEQQLIWNFSSIMDRTKEYMIRFL